MLYIPAVRGIGLRHHMEIPAVDGEVIHVLASEISLNGVVHFCQGNAEFLTLIPVYIQFVSRCFSREEGLSAVNLRPFIDLSDKIVYHLFKMRNIICAFLLLQFKGESAGSAKTRNGRR